MIIVKTEMGKKPLLKQVFQLSLINIGEQLKSQTFFAVLDFIWNWNENTDFQEGTKTSEQQRDILKINET